MLGAPGSLKLRAAGAILAGMAGAAHAADSNARYVVRGEISCPAFLEARQTNDSIRHEWWIAGWLTASNFHLAETFDIVAQDTTRGDIMTWLEDYCRTHESDGLNDAMEWLFRGLYPSRVTEGPTP